MSRDAAESDEMPLPIDDCWNRIGVHGDQSCPKLAEHLRCLNCAVYAAGAARLLDRPLEREEIAGAAPRASAAVRTAAAPADTDANAKAARTHHAVLAFRIADEWLALPTGMLREIADMRTIRSLPHRRHRAVIGIVNVRGALRVAVSLAELLGLDSPAAAPGAPRGWTRMLVVAHGGDPVVFPVDEVEGVLRFDAAAWLGVPATVARSLAAHSRGVFAWRDRTIGLVDEDRLFESLNRSLR